MQYYSRRKNHRYISFIALIIFMIIIFNMMIVFFDKRIIPSITEIGIIMVKAQTLDIINEKSVNILSQEFRYDQIIKIEKDNEGNISTKYESKFESAGINQTIHKIYLNITAKLRMIKCREKRSIKLLFIPN